MEISFRCPWWPEFGLNRARSRRHRPPNSADIGRNRSNPASTIGRRQAKSSPIWTDFGLRRIRPTPARFGSMSTEAGSSWPNLGRLRPISAKYRPKSTNSGAISTDALRPISAQLGLDLGPESAQLGTNLQIWATQGGGAIFTFERSGTNIAQATGRECREVAEWRFLGVAHAIADMGLLWGGPQDPQGVAGSPASKRRGASGLRCGSDSGSRGSRECVERGAEVRGCLAELRQNGFLGRHGAGSAMSRSDQDFGRSFWGTSFRRPTLPNSHIAPSAGRRSPRSYRGGTCGAGCSASAR